MTLLFHVAMAEVIRWPSIGEWASLEDPTWLHSYVSRDGWKVGFS